MTVKLSRKLFEQYLSRRKGWEIDGKTGFLVPKNVKLDEAEPEFTRAAAFAKVVDADGKELGEGKGYDPKQKLFIGGIANAHETDRMNEVLRPTGVQLNAYNKNNILLLQHCHADPVGLCTTMRPEDNGVHFEAWVGDPAAAPLTKKQEETRSLVAQRILKAVSVGFIPLKIRMPAYDDNGRLVDPAVIEEWEMLELSIVSVPCNAGALFELKTAGDKTLKLWSFPTLGTDGKFIVKTPKESENMDELKALLEKQLTVLNTVASSLNGLKDGQDSLQKSIDGLGAPGKKGKKKPKEDDEEEEEEEDEEAEKRLTALEKKLKSLGDEQTKLGKTMEKLVESMQLVAAKIA